MNESHPAEEQLTAHAVGDLDVGERRRIAEHVAACEPCRAAASSIARALEEVRGAGRRDAPPAILVKLQEEQSGRRRRLRVPAAAPFGMRWAVGGAATLALCFLAGFWVGRGAERDRSVPAAAESGGQVMPRPLPEPPPPTFHAAPPLDGAMELAAGSSARDSL